MAFPLNGDWYLVPHDDIVGHFRDSTNYLESPSWIENGAYHFCSAEVGYPGVARDLPAVRKRQ